jgi:PAS domain S-box-containing protein
MRCAAQPGRPNTDASIMQATMRPGPKSSTDPLAQLAAIVASASDGIIGTDVDGIISTWSPGAERLFGYSAAEALGQSLALIMTAERRALLPGLLNRAFRGEAEERLETVAQLKGGRHRPVAVSLFPIRDSGGDVTGMGCIARDITEQKKGEAALRASEQRVRRLIDSNLIGITLGELDGRILDANDALLRMVGYTRHDLAEGRLRWDAMTPPEYLAAEERAIAEAHRVGSARPWEKEYIRKDGTRIPVLVGFSLLDEEAGTTVAFILDLSERRQAEAERERLVAQNRRQQALLEAVFAATPAGLAVVAGNPPTIRFVNPAYHALAPHDGADNLVGRTLEEVWPDAGKSGVLRLVTGTLESREPAALERYERNAADGSIRSFSLQVVGLAWQNEPAALVVLWETTALEHARAGAEAAVRARDEFISVAAHELRTPISALLALSQLSRARLDRTEQLEPDQARELVDLVHWQADRLSRLAAQLLDTSRIKAGQLKLQLEPTDLVALVRDVARASSQDRAIEIHAPPTLGADVDPLRFEQVVRNLLDNAIKYSPEGGPIEVEVDQPTADAARVAVRDHGIGVPEEHRAHIFERFYRAHPEGLTSGMGLGLHISRQIVEQHGGWIDAEFPADGGTRLVVTVPTKNRARRVP